MVSAQTMAASSARKVIEADIEEHAQTIILLKRQLNTHTDIGRLPTEILSEVFVHLCRHHYETRQSMLFNATGTSDAYYYGLHLVPWIKVAHICHAWREIALSTPRLWSYVVVGFHQAYLDELVARSKKAPLHITAVLPSYPSSDSEGCIQGLESIITSHTSRLVELYLSAFPVTIREICHKLCNTASAPLLRSLVLWELPSDHGWNSDLLHVLRSLSPQALPALCTLDCRRLTFAWDEPIFSATALTKLVVYGRLDSQEVMGSFESLLNALQSMTLLETLELDNAIPRLPVDATSILPPSRKITLPHLQHLSITSNGVDCANLLGHLSTSTQTTYHLNTTRPGGPDLATVLKDHLASSEPLQAILLQRRHHMRQVLEGRRAPITDFETGNSYYTPLPSGDVHVDMPIMTNASFFTPLFSSTTVFHGVQTLEITVPETHSNYSWEFPELFAAMPNIHVLSLGGDQTEALTDALSTPHPDDQGNIMRELPLQRLEVLKLRDISLVSVDEYQIPEFLDLLIDCLMARCYHDVPVAELHLKYCRNTLPDDVDRLKEVVADVQWDGIERIEEVEVEDDRFHNVFWDDDDDYDSWGSDGGYGPWD